MKKLLFVLLASFIFFAASGQTTPVKNVQDTAVTETTPLLSIQDIQLVVEKILADQPMRYSEPVRNALYSLLNQRADEYKKKLQAKANK